MCAAITCIGDFFLLRKPDTDAPGVGEKKQYLPGTGFAGAGL